MSSAPVLDLDTLLAPVPGGDPAGSPASDALRMEVEENRREPDPDDPTTAHWTDDWPKVLRLATAALTDSGKDMYTATRLVEAATKVHGVAGLRDGLTLLRRLVTECWDRLHPVPADGDTTDVREGPVKALNVNGRTIAFPQTILELPVFGVPLLSRAQEQEKFSPVDLWDPGRKAALDQAVAAARLPALEELRGTHADLVAARQELAGLAAALAERRVDPDDAPDYTSPERPGNLGGAIEKCIEMVERIARDRALPLATGTAAAGPSSDGGAAAAAPGPGPAAPAGTRDGLYRQIEQVAAGLRRLEPHSPIPFLLERCVRLGRLPFPELMRAILREAAALDELDRLLGIERPG